MNNAINLPAVLIANIMGTMLCMMMLTGRRWKMAGMESETKALRIMLIASMISCLADPLVFWLDGHPGFLPRLAVYAGNVWLYLSNIIIGSTWFILVVCHSEGQLSRLRKSAIYAISVVGVLTLIINLFVPIVFTVDENSVYSRGPLYWLFLAIDAFFMIDGVIAYLCARRKGGILQFFPVWQFIVPAIIGGAIQTFSYGVSAIWPCMAISINSMLYCLQSEVIFRDGLTGLYNRHYLEYLSTKLGKKKDSSACIAAMMIDLNDFKHINDAFGHRTGDKALIESGLIIKKATGTLGNVIRYAGDEFIVLLNTQDMNQVQEIADRIKNAMEERNHRPDAPYFLSASVGSCMVDFSRQTPDQIMNAIDARMYDDKRQFYQNNPEHNRRRSE